ncbi:MFS transporter [Nocardioides maradonensis]
MTARTDPTPLSVPSQWGSTGPDRRAQRSRGALLVASFGAFLAFLDATIVNICFPAIQQTFHGSSTSALAWVLNAYNLVFAAMLVAGGRLADVIGRRRMFSIGVAMFTAASVLCASAHSLDLLIFWRVWQALGAALLVPASLGVVIHAATEERRGHAVSLWGATAALAAGLGPPIGGAIVAASSWRLAFLVNLPLGLAALWFGSRLIDESRSPGKRSMPDLPGVGVLALALAALSLGIIRGPDWHWTSPSTLGCFAVAGALLVVVGLRTVRHPVPVVDPSLLRIRTFAVANLATALAGMGMYAYLLNHILWLTYVWHLPLWKAGLAVAPSALVTALVAPRLGEVAQKHGFRNVAVPGALVWVAGLWWFVHHVGTSPHYLHDWLPGAILAGAGAGATLPILGSAALAAVPGGRYATASSVVSAVRQMGGVLGVSVLVVIVGKASPLHPAAAVEMFRDGWRLSLWCFAAVAVAAALMTRPEAVDEGTPAPAEPQLQHNDVASADQRGVGQLSAFRDIAPEAVDRLAAVGVRREVLAGEALCRAGEPAEVVYVVVAGRIAVVRAGVVVDRVGGGAVVGELGVLAGRPRSADLVAERDSVVVEVGVGDLRSALEEVPGAGWGLAGMLAEQIARLPAPARQAGPPSTIAVLGLGNAPARDAAAKLADLIGVHRTVAVVDRPLDASALAAVEADHDRVLLVAGTDPAHADFCRRHADVVVLVAHGDPRGVAPVPGCEVLLDGPTNPRRVTAWMDATGARRVHQAALGGREQLAARLAGRSLGIALAGGGARAFAHIGVLHEVEAAGVVVHRVAGTSVGSYVGALYAAGHSPADIEAIVREEFVHHNPVGDYGLPKYALSRGGRIAAAAARVYGDATAESLPRELTVMATDIHSHGAVALRRGLLRDITRASAAVPGLLPPVVHEGRVYVDGAVTGNLPVLPLAGESAGPVIALDLSVGSGEPRPRNAGAPRPPRVPTLPETLMRTLLFAAAEENRRAARAADLVVRIQTRNIGLLEFHQIDTALEAGRAAGRRLVAELAEQPLGT